MPLSYVFFVFLFYTMPFFNNFIYFPYHCTLLYSLLLLLLLLLLDVCFIISIMYLFLSFFFSLFNYSFSVFFSFYFCLLSISINHYFSTFFSITVFIFQEPKQLQVHTPPFLISSKYFHKTKHSSYPAVVFSLLFWPKHHCIPFLLTSKREIKFPGTFSKTTQISPSFVDPFFFTFFHNTFLFQ